MSRCLICDEGEEEETVGLLEGAQGKVDGYFVLKQVLEVPEPTLEGYLRGCPDVGEWVKLCVGCGDKVERCKRLWMDYLEVKRQLIGKIKELEGVKGRREVDGGEVRDILEETRDFVKRHEYYDEDLDKIPEVVVVKKEEIEVDVQDDKEEDPFFGTGGMENEEETEPCPATGMEVEETISDQESEEDPQATYDDDDHTSLSEEVSDIEEPAPRTLRKSTRSKTETKVVNERKPRKRKNYVHNRSLKCPFCPHNCSPCGGDKFYSHVLKCLQKFQAKSHFTPEKLPQLVCPYCKKYNSKVDEVTVKHYVEHTVWCQHLQNPLPGYDQGIPLKWRLLQCSICGEHQKYMKVNQFLGHYRSHKRSIHRCPLCPQQHIAFQNALQFRQHWNECHSNVEKSGPVGQKKIFNPNPRLPQVPWWCPQCNLEFPTDLLRNDHHLSSHPERSLDLNHKCSQCSSSFLCQEELQLHQGTVHMSVTNFSSNFTCVQCSKHFETKLLLESHNSQFHLQVSCELCQEQFVGSKELTLHQRTSHYSQWKQKRFPKRCQGEPDPTCDICHKTFSCMKSLRTHQNLVHKGLRKKKPAMQCEVCGKTISARVMPLHLQTIHGIGIKKSYPCSVEGCSKVFYSKDRINIHLKWHGNEIDRRFKCQFCGKGFPFRNKLTQHELRHTNQREHACEHCPKMFKNMQDLYLHKYKIHSVKSGNIPWKPRQDNKTDFQCEICTKGFATLPTLTKHKETVHLKRFQVECDLCSKSFLDANRLKLHKMFVHRKDKQKGRLQIKEKVFKCSVEGCGKAFTSSTMLNDHKSQHEGVPKYKCRVCDKAFFLCGNKYRHERMIHKDKKQEIDDSR